MAMLRLLASSRVAASPRILPGLIANASFSRSANAFSRTTDQDKTILSEKQLLDRYLAKVLKSEIKSKQLSLEKCMPVRVPFTIQGDPCHKISVNLTREFDGEKIDVLVLVPLSMPKDYGFSDTCTSYDDDDDDGSGGGGADHSSSTDSDSDHQEKEKSRGDPAPSVSLSVRIPKENGKMLRFHVSASTDEINIESMSVKESADLWSRETTYTVDRDGDLKEYLKIRGIKKSTAGFLYK